MEYVIAFISGGLICLVGQIFIDIFKQTPVHVTSLFVVIGVILEGLGVYEHFIHWAGAGATVPITGFGYSLFHGVIQEANGVSGIGIGAFDWLLQTILFAFMTAVIFKPKG
ncbi:SpoVA/SpoVAEb family sporulation membrane protein [Bacillus alveayuensis]|jgi:stage V sporulation protein AE|uniref:SpoVA/SpoVAEb family sporulation membrane protein n=1 Tax=Aeribacillus alveayuensis TaxID=279215 RepID=UPI0005D11B63|nr:SpoVA/SpoVAEb family sporulation membrane protein [Bacillus alveayuensis]